MREYCDIVIVGAGASGLMAGALLSREGFSVTMIDKNDRAAKKLRATGNGRCNFTNLNMKEDCFFGQRDFIKDILEGNTPEDIIKQFESFGVYARQKDGYVYPYSNQAVTVTSALIRQCRQCELVLDTKVGKILPPEKDKPWYEVRTTEGIIKCHQVILACGGSAARELGGSSDGYRLARKLGHTVTEIYPALAPLKTKESGWELVAGTRIQGRFSLEISGKVCQGETGEIQITKEGVSGIPVFQLSARAVRALEEGDQVYGVVDFIPPMSQEETKRWIHEHGPEGLLPVKWVEYFEQQKIPVTASLLKQYKIRITGGMGMERAQVSCGGVVTEEVSPAVCESLIHKGLFFTGEILDVQGICGGYNLHFAFSCARRAAGEIIRRKKEER